MGVHFKIFCGCGAYPAADPVVSAARPCSDAQGRDRKSPTTLHARLATVSLRAFDRDTGTFTVVVDPVDAKEKVDPVDAKENVDPVDATAKVDPVDTGTTADPITVTFLPSEYIAARATGLAEFEDFLRTARPGAPFTFIGRWVTRTWESRAGDLCEIREFEATRFAEGHHDHATLCGPWPDGPLSCPALAARQLLETHLPAAARTPPGPPPCTAPLPGPDQTETAAWPKPSLSGIRLPSIRTDSLAPHPRPASEPNPWSPARLLGLAPRQRLILSDPAAPAAALTPCARTADGLAAKPCRTPGCCPPNTH